MGEVYNPHTNRRASHIWGYREYSQMRGTSPGFGTPQVALLYRDRFATNGSVYSGKATTKDSVSAHPNISGRVTGREVGR